MSTKETLNVALCDCCAIYAANHDKSGCEYGCPDGHADKLLSWPDITAAAEQNGDDLAFIFTYLEDDHFEFCTRPCAGCGDNLAGSRSAAQVSVTYA